MADPDASSPARDENQRIYVEDTDAQLPRYQATGYGRYADFQPLAQGGSAVLRTCRDKNLGRTVVMKTLHPHLADNEYMAARFLREARVTAQLQHPVTVPVYDIGRDLEKRLYFTMKKVVGDELRDVIERQLKGHADALETYNLERLLGVLIQVCNGLAYAHAHGVVHRDVKPENIIVGRFGEVILLDWGVAKVWSTPDDDPTAKAIEHEVLTDVNQRPGTPLYMSPEQVRGGGVIDERTDVYGIGAVLYETLTLHEPLRGQRVADTFDLIKNQRPIPPRKRAPDRQIPAALADICMKALEKEPEHRYHSMDAMITDLRRFRTRALQSVTNR